MIKLRNLSLFLLVFALAACAQFQMQKPVTAEDYVQSAKGQVTAAYNSVADLKVQGSITGPQALDYIAKIDKARDDINKVSDLVLQGKVTDPQSALKLTLAALLLVQNELIAKGK